jgi:hypothetical protein
VFPVSEGDTPLAAQVTFVRHTHDENGGHVEIFVLPSLPLLGCSPLPPHGTEEEEGFRWFSKRNSRCVFKKDRDRAVKDVNIIGILFHNTCLPIGDIYSAREQPKRLSPIYKLNMYNNF